ncbi:hypothetical protein SRHO_G00223500 [Serrasalmus rhombeus]
MNRARRHCGSSQTDAGRCCRGVQTRATPPIRARLESAAAEHGAEPQSRRAAAPTADRHSESTAECGGFGGDKWQRAAPRLRCFSCFQQLRELVAPDRSAALEAG